MSVMRSLDPEVFGWGMFLCSSALTAFCFLMSIFIVQNGFIELAFIVLGLMSLVLTYTFGKILGL